MNDNPVPQDPAKIRERIQQEIVSLITRKLESGEINEERAKAIAKLTLEKLPEDINYEDLVQNLTKMDDEFIELQTIILPIVLDYQSKMATKMQAQISELMQQQKYQEALELTKKAVEFEKKLL